MMGTGKFKHHLLATSIATVLGAAAVIPATAVAAQGDDQVEVIEVRGIRASAKASINTKRFNDSVVDAITAEDIGKFPDNNVAESLSRITGVAVSREFGEGEKITIRGSDATKNRTLLNGQNVATADWFILDSPSRGFNFTLLPSSLVSDLEVYKSSQADIDEGSIGGTVLMRTRRPLQLDANTFQFSAKGQYSEVSEEFEPNLSGLYSWKNDQESYGFLISAVSDSRTVVREGVEVLGWNDVDGGGKVPSVIGVPRFEQERERTTVFGSFQIAPGDNWDLTFNALYSELDSDNQNQNWLIFPGNNVADLTDTAVTNGNIVAGTAQAGTMEYNFINRESRTETESYDLDFNYAGDAFSFHAQVGTTQAEGGTYNEASYSAGPVSGGGYDYDLRGTPQLNTTIDSADPSQVKPGWIWGGNKPTTDEETYAQFDFDIPVELGAFTAIKTGLKYRDHERTQDRQVYSWHGPGTSSNPDSSYLADFFAQCVTWAECGLGDKGSVSVGTDVVSGNMTQQIAHNRDAMWNIAFGPDADYAISEALNEIWAVKEEIFAGYVMGNFDGEGFRGNVGVRVVSTDQTASSYQYSGNSPFRTIDREWLTVTDATWVTETRSYTEVLPSFNIAFDMTYDQIVRFSAARVMARPNFSDLAPVAIQGDLGVAQPRGTRGNPNLLPEIANQYDLAWEWYFDDASLFSATYFYKDIQSYRTSGETQSYVYDEETDSDVLVTFTQPLNGAGGSTEGVELTYQHDFGGFGVITNYTYTDAGNDEARDIAVSGSGLVPGVSEHMANVTAYYENDTFGARLMYNYRTEWYKGLHYSGAELWNDDFGQLDFSSSYDVTDNVQIVFEAVNLTDEEVVEFSTDKSRLMSIYQNGRRFVIGANLRF
ncbi:TonB-dependent receptor [Ferrimonas pelagia]|uniref:TonB-dependent receptor n=1 Tax=Ferrimonas pelagia TaxID=1177826 RepID=A0ABP9EBE9_9GAMM